MLAEVPPWEKLGFLLGLLHQMGQWAIVGFASTLSQRGWTDRSLRAEILDPEAPDQALLAKLEILGIDEDRLLQIVDESLAAYDVLCKIN